MPHRHKNETMTARVQVVPSFYLLLIHERNEESGIEEYQGAVESGGRDAEDGVGILVHLNDAADDAAIVLKMRMPIRIAEHDVGRAVWAVLIGSVEETTEERLQAQDVEIVPAR